MQPAAHDIVRERAANRCEYCGLDQKYSDLAHQVQFVVSQKQQGSDHPDNLALACHRCTLRKGPNLTGVDPERGDPVPLYHPRWDHWSNHFVLHGARIEGTSPVGRATVFALGLNDARRVELRAELLARGVLA
ncbi:MAG TPA: HNH endonuclease [Bryobacteraceae bacterium]|nr:HNH endonuclease [Bryobacteraceae bacterium]